MGTFAYSIFVRSAVVGALYQVSVEILARYNRSKEQKAA